MASSQINYQFSKDGIENLNEGLLVVGYFLLMVIPDMSKYLIRKVSWGKRQSLGELLFLHSGGLVSFPINLNNVGLLSFSFKILTRRDNKFWSSSQT